MKKLINEQFKRMQLLAGIITESEYKAKLIEDNTERLPDGKWYCKLSKDTAYHKAGTWMYVNAKDKEEAIKGFGEEFDLSTLTNVNPTSESTDIEKNESQLDEVDSSLLGGVAKNLYLYLSKMKPNNPVDVDGNPLKNVKGDIIKNDPKVKMTYQNTSVGMDKLAMQGKSKELEKSHQGNQHNAEITLSYSGNMIYALGFVKKEEAESALKEMLNKYPKEITGEVKTDKMEYDWAKHYAPTYSITITMKSDKELARTQSAKPTATSTPQQESQTNEIFEFKESIEKSVNEALRKFRNRK